MVKLLHREGIEVILDVVYNHTAEQGRDGATLSWRGLDNRAYYRLDERGQRHRRHRLRQHPRPAPPGGLPDGAGLAALLGRGVPRRRLPVRPRRGARAAAATTATTPTTRSWWRCAPTRCSPGSSSSPSRGTSASHGWRTGQFPPPFAEWNDRFRDGVRSFWLADVGPLRATASPATACASWPPGSPARRTCSAPATAGRSPRSTSSPPTTASPSPTPRPTSASTTRPTARATATATTTTGRGTTASRARPTTRTSLRGPAPVDAQPARHPAAVHRRADAQRRRRAGPHPAAATTTPTARTTRSPGSTGTSTVAAADLLETTRHLPACAPRTPVLRQRAFFTGRPVARRTAATDLSGSPPTASRWTTAAGTTRTRRTLQMYLDGASAGRAPRCSSSCTATPRTRR